MKLDTRKIRSHKLSSDKKPLQMLTCYDYQTAQLLNDTELDLILVGDSVGNVILGYDHTIQVTLETMILFSKAVKKGAPDKFVVADLPFGTYGTLKSGIQSAVRLFQESGVEALKLEGAFPFQCELIERLTQIGIPIMGHIGLTPQSVHEQGGYYTHGKNAKDKERLALEAEALERAGVFSIVLEFVEEKLAASMTSKLKVPTIGIGSGVQTDGQVLVINDLLHMGKKGPPKFCHPIGNVYEFKNKLINQYLNKKHV